MYRKNKKHNYTQISKEMLKTLSKISEVEGGE